jgi:hypothetical protein
MDVFSYQAIVLNRAIRIENACFADPSSAIDHCAIEHNGARP